MRSQIAVTETSIDPTAQLWELLHLLERAAAGVVLGALLGAGCARLMRRLDLHWTWAAVALVIALTVRFAATPATAVVCVAALVAAFRGRRWHREDDEAGADLAELAARRRSPLDVLRALARGSVNRCRARAWPNRRPESGAALILGRDEDGHPARVPIVSGSGGAHTLIIGATGSGKTVTQSLIAAHAVERGMAAIVVDPKGDDQMRDALARAAHGCGRRFIEWTPDGDAVYNPYGRGSDTEIADKVLASERFTEPHYQRQAQRYLGHVARSLREADVPVSLRTIVRHLDPLELEVLVRDLAAPNGEPHATHAYLDSLTSRQAGDLAGVRDRLAIVAESDVGRWLDPDTAGCEQFDVLDAVHARSVVYVNLDADRRPLLAQMLGRALVQDLQTAVASLQHRPVPTLAVIDEFSALGAEHVVRLFGRARSAGVSMLLGTQELADLRFGDNGRLLEQVLGNLSVLIAHRQVVPGSATLVASMSGTRGAWRTAQHSDGRATRTRISRPVLSADQLGRLRTGWAAVLLLGGETAAQIVRVIPNTSKGGLP